jgi:cell wall-associated NlpC family hydrolase
MISQQAAMLRKLILPVLLAVVLPACAVQAPDANRESSVVGERAAAVALEQLGVPYRYGGSAPSGFDCSGLVQFAYRSAGKPVPRTTKALWEHVQNVDRNRLQAGDLLFFRIDGRMSHVGLYIGENRFVHAPATGRVVSIESLGSPFYSAALIRAGRP